MTKITYENHEYDTRVLLLAGAETVRTAGTAIMDVYVSADIGAEIKSDNTPVTKADKASEDVILPALKQLTPNIPILSEEQVAIGNIPDISGGTFWTVDPLDGTKDFINQTGGFAVLVSLIHEGEPILGLVYHPAQGTLYAASVTDNIALKRNDFADTVEDLNAPSSQPPTDGTVRAVVNKSSGDVEKITEFLEKQSKGTDNGTIENQFKINKHDVIAVTDRGAQFVFCPVAEGKADLYAHISKSKGDGAPFWDVAAGHALVTATGGKVTDFDGKPLKYTPNPHETGARALRLAPHVAVSRDQLARDAKPKTPKPPKKRPGGPA
ncbi:MAG: 3'(2'),5'-bisphosphate nucleotidase CysQ [Alphaproteobacteria bacterium]|nr:MAG: 3'(2'),5'-bisphosphate nucleotidase CysQ [Alphaproteobacteria bacterium]